MTVQELIEALTVNCKDKTKQIYFDHDAMWAEINQVHEHHDCYTLSED